jgi:anti-sigma-K factor RskA
MSCDELRDLYELYALGVLDAEDRLAAEEHLATGCQDCAEALRRALAANAAILKSVDQVDPPKSLREKMESAFAPKPRRGFFLGYGWIFTTAAVLLLAVLIVSQQRIRNQRLQAALEFAALPGVQHVVFDKDGVHGSVFVHAQRGVLLTVSGLRPAPAGKVYEMWIVPKSGAPQAIGSIRTTFEGKGAQIVARSIDPNVAAVAVSLEPVDSPMEKPTEVLFAAPL